VFPKSDWEIYKWTKTDTVGFVICWLAVAVIIGMLWMIIEAAK
jgi:hypothetical protein